MDLKDATWRKSARSSDNGGYCVELARVPGRTAVRDSKNPDGGHLTLTPSAFAALLAEVKQGRYDT